MKLMHRFALEEIRFQDDNFMPKMADVIRPYTGGSEFLSRKKQTDLCREMEALVFNRFGFESEFICSTDGAYILPPDITANNALLSMDSKYLSGEDGLKMIKQAKGSINGSINLEKATVSGFFSKFRPKINIDLTMLKGKRFTPEEIAAVNLHEIGHFFTICEMISHVVSTNRVLVGVDKALRNQPDPKQIEFILREAGAQLDVEKSVIEEAVKSPDLKTSVVVLVAASCKSVRSEYGNPLYDYNGCEMMADQFATRMGAGRELMTALDKFHSDFGETWATTRTTWLLKTIADLIGQFCASAFVGSLFLFANTTLAFIVFGIILSLFFIGSAKSGGLYYSDVLYETPEQRCLRVRRQLIQLSKDPKVSQFAAKKIIEDCAELQRIANQYKELESFWAIVGRFLFSSTREKLKSVEFQRNLEKLALNDLFLKSLELKHA